MARTAPRLYVDAPLGCDAPVETGAATAHYLRSVMRLSPGDPVTLFNGRDGEWRALLVRADRNSALLRPVTRLRGQMAAPDLWLVFALIKRGPLDFLLHKATELGVARLLPVITARTNIRDLNLERAAATLREAAEQCERLDLPVVSNPVPLDTLLRDWPADRALYACAEAGAVTPAAQAFAAHGAGRPAALLTGPEGGFTEVELDMLRHCPFVAPVGLGPRLLRAETAALAALACWQALAGDGAARPPLRPQQPAWDGHEETQPAA